MIYTVPGRKKETTTKTETIVFKMSLGGKTAEDTNETTLKIQKINDLH